MTQTIIGPDGIKHSFPDETSDDVIKKVMGQNYPNTVGNPPPATGQTPSSTPDPLSPTSALIGRLAMPLRAFNKGLTGNLWDPAVGAIKSVFSGSPTGQSIQQEEGQTKEAESQMGPGASIALEGAGTIAGPGKLMQTENAARLAAPGISRFLTRLGGGAAEGSIYGGEQALTEGKSIVPNSTAFSDMVSSPMIKGGAIGGATSAAVPVFTGVASQLSKLLPGGKLPPPPSSSDFTRGPGDWSFRSAADQATAEKLKQLENMEYNSQNAGDSLPTQVKSLLRKDVETGQSGADRLGYSVGQNSQTIPGAQPVLSQPNEQGALANVGNTTPVSSFVQQHPRVSMSVLGPISELPALAIAAKGNPEGAIIPGLMGGAVDIGAYKGTQYLANKGAQAALDNAKRIIAGQSTSTDMQNAVNDPQFGQALQALMFNQSLGQ